MALGARKLIKWYLPLKRHGNGSFRDPNGIRTRVTAVKGRCPRPLDDRVKEAAPISEAHLCVASYLRTSTSPRDFSESTSSAVRCVAPRWVAKTRSA